jgi:cytoplasmic iron level regulating protein YaaA (DUF328/UPF0246 family)
MLIILSPSKTLDYKNEVSIPTGEDPQFIKDAKKLATLLRKLSPASLSKLMNISPKLAQENALRYSEWHYPYPSGKARPALSAFKGDVYEGLKGWELDQQQIEFANRHLRILSGLYGLLKPTDMMLPYRLEMGTSLEGKNYANLYEFWGNKLTRSAKQAIKTSGNNTLINLASAEYAKAVDFNALKTNVITPVFKEFREGEYKFITFNAKRARGLMTRYIIDHNISDPEQIKLFDYEGYGFMEQLSSGDQWVFVR